MPPLTYAPTGTSLRRWRSTESAMSSRSRSSHSPGVSEKSGSYCTSQ
jgi:hypothetical protein